MISKQVKPSERQKPLLSFVALKGFAAYILENKLQDAGALNLQLAQEYNLPLLQFVSHLSQEELLALSVKGQSDFYQQVLSDTAGSCAAEDIEKWRLNQHDIIVQREEVKLKDLVLTYSIRKQVSLKLLPDYTSDCHLLVEIMQELENFYSWLERLAVQVYVDIQQEDLYKKNQFLSSLIENSLEGILAFDSQMEVTEWNPSLEKSLGISKKDILGKPLLEFFPALDNAPIMQAFRLSLQGEAIHFPNGVYTSKDGFYEANTTPLYDEENNISGALAVIHDITHRIKIEERLKENKEELLAANEELTEQQEELQAANEELRASNEELREQREEIEALNEELQESMTQLEETQEILNHTIQQFEEAQAIAHLGSYEYHIGSDQLNWSTEMKRIFGVAEDASGFNFESYQALLHPKDRQMVLSTIEQAMQVPGPYSFEHRVLRRDGSVKWILANGQAVHSNGKVYKLQGTALDITERKLADLQLQKEQFFIQKITETSPDVITVFDLEKGTNVYGNRELTEVLGYSTEEIQELRDDPAFLQKILHPDDLAMAATFLEEFKTYTGTAAREIEYRARRKSGEYIWVSARYNVFRRNTEGFPVQIIGVTHNINQRKLAEEELKHTIFKLHETNEELVRTEELLKEANNELEDQVMRRTAELERKNLQLTRINADLDNFIYTASHDLKVPIVNLEGLLILLNKKLEDKLEEKDQNLLAMMQTSIERFKNTIQDLSDLTKMQKNLEEDLTEEVLLPELIEDIKSDISRLMADNRAGIELSLDVKEIPFDRKNLRSILYNLITNAIKYRSADRQPQVKLSTRYTPQGVLICVEDNGEGIPENQHEKIFSLFKRLHKNIEGSGMGLYIVKRIVDNNGGRIEVESQVGKGTTFKIYLQND